MTTKQYLWDQLDKHRMIDPVEDILKQFENQTHQNKTYTHNEQLGNVPAGNSIGDHNKRAHNTSEITKTKER